jgi:hypothetical protein
MKPATRRLFWFLAVSGTVAAVAWVSGRDDEVIAVAGVQRADRHRGETGAAAKGVAQGIARGMANGAAPVLRLEQLEARAFDDMKADLIAAKSWYVPPPVVVEKPRPPPLPFKYSGRMIEDGRTTVFLAQQDRNRPVKSGDLLDNTWRVDAIDATTMTFTYLPLNESQTLALGAAP